MEVLHDVRAQRRIGVGRAIGCVAGLALLASCGDAPDRASQPVDTATIEDRRIFEGEVGRDSGALAGDTLVEPDTFGGIDTPEVDAERTLILAADSAAGFLLYHRSAGCIACHGADGQGLENLGPSLTDGVWLHIDGSVREIEDVIRTGIARPLEAMIAMPALVSRLDPAETHRVAAYVYSLSHPGAVVADTTAARDSLRGPMSDTLRPVPGNPAPYPTRTH